jgi:hypothetical protein
MASQQAARKAWNEAMKKTAYVFVLLLAAP